MQIKHSFGRSPDRGRSPIVTLPDDRLHERRPVLEHDPAGVQRAKDETQADQELLALARSRFQTASNAESTLRSEMVEDQRFYNNKQWPDQVVTERSADKRPILTTNRMPQFVKQITNPERQARPSIQVNPVNDGADPDTAEVLQGIIRHIEHTSHAETAYDEAFEDAVICGRGFFRILTQYVDDGSFEQEIVVRRVPNPLAVYVDPAAQELDYSDARYMFVVEDIPQDEYRELYGDASMSSLDAFQSMGDRQVDWFPEGKIRIAEYFYIEKVERTICLIEDADGDQLTVPQDRVPEGATILKRRTVREPVVRWLKINGAEVLERKTWPGRWIPIIPVLGDEVVVDGSKDLVGIVRYARDPQRMYNFWISALTETIALAPRAPYVGVEGQFKGHETEWKQANVKNLPYLEYASVSLDGKPAPPPQRTQYEPAIAAIVQAIKMSDNDLKSVIGFYDASLGERGPEESGKAILARQKQGETGNANFIDNLGRALWHAGRVYLDLIPKIYDTPRMVHILGGDDQRQQVLINDAWIKDGVEKVFDVRVGRYNVTLTMGPSYQSRRQEAVASMLQLVEADPQLIPIIGDLLVGEMDWPMAKAISGRLKKMLPPQLQDQKPGEGPDPQQLVAQLGQAKQIIQQQHDLLGKQKQMLDSKQMETLARSRDVQAKIESDERREVIRANAGIAEAALKAQNENDATVFEAATTRMSEAMQHLKDVQMQANDHAHDLRTQALDHAQDTASQGAEQAQDAAAQEAEQAHARETQAADQAHELTTQAAEHDNAKTLAAMKPAPQKPGAKKT